MGHGKLKKFAENETFRCLLQPAADEVLAGRGHDFLLKDHPVKGHWNEQVFDAARPIVLELGCGRGEYCIGLARRSPECNYVGVDIKGARLWKGAKEATVNNMGNVAFLRTRIEFIEAFFAPGEVSEIWLTFSDPQLRHENSRLSSPMFLERYRKFLKPGGLIHLKTDSRFLYEYTLALCKENGLDIVAATNDLYGHDSRRGCRTPLSPDGDVPPVISTEVEKSPSSVISTERSEWRNLRPEVREVKTYYETMFSRQGYKITYLCFRLPSSVVPGSPSVMSSEVETSLPLRSPASFDADYWRSVEGPRHSVALPDFDFSDKK
ncbi:MAG: tRNA (guanosine(46)-N7)-methyltransferase TrmB [Bacteroidales bacterium]|nr:tRNA (guanosine(46)-N7)-methyltransferase TrmB [Bacteroidales bacterium]MBQ9186118.1 tRNA (guanosine(46)-N7)-methyltransferase TrmB [Bacteroidales bacterium]